MRAAQSYTTILTLIVFVCAAPVSPIFATEGSWRLVDYEYFGFVEALPGHTEWAINHTRGPDDRWVVDLTISGYEFNPTAVLIGDAEAYERWRNTGSVSQFTFVAYVNATLDTTVDLAHQSQWYFVMNNTSPVTIYFTLSLIRFHWSTEPPTTTAPDFFVYLSSMIGYFVIIAIIVGVIIPCLCGCGCSRRKRGRRQRAQDSEVHHHYTTYLVVSPDHIRSIDPLQDEEERW